MEASENLMNDALWKAYLEAIDRRDTEARKAYQEQWWRYQHRVEMLRRSLMKHRNRP